MDVHDLGASATIQVPGSGAGASSGGVAAGAGGYAAGRDVNILRQSVVVPAAFHQLPHDIADFTGREREMSALRATLERAYSGQSEAQVIVAIAGQPGVGKSALAVHVAHELSSRYADAQLYVNLRGHEGHPLDPQEALAEFLRTLGVAAEAVPPTMEEREALYRSLLWDRRVLLLLDNAHGSEQVRHLLPACSTCAVLITSRSPLGGLEGAVMMDLESMNPEEAMRLLARVAGRDRIESEVRAAQEVARLCGYLPLALRIAGAKLKLRTRWSLETLARRLADERHRLGELGVEDLEVRTSFALSYQELDGSRARMFRRLGLVAGPDFAPYVAAVLTETLPEEAEHLLEGLVDDHLVEEASALGRYRFHDLLRLYARERLEADESAQDCDRALGCMLDWYLKAVDVAGQLLTPFLRPPFLRRQPRESLGEHHEPVLATRAQALAWLDAERPNLVAATRQAADHGLHEVTWQLAEALWSFFLFRRHLADWQETHRVGIAAAQQAHHRVAVAALIGELGVAYRELRRFDEAIDCFQQALQTSREVGERWGEGAVLVNLGIAYRELRRFDEAIVCFHRAVVTLREVGARWLESMSLRHLGIAYRELRRFDEALDSFQQALAICREVGDSWMEGLILGNLGATCRELRRCDEAISFLQQALAALREVGDHYYESVALYSLGETYADLRSFEEAIDYCQQALAIRRQIGDRWSEAMTLTKLGHVRQQVQDADAAQACWREALRIFTDLHAPEADKVRACLTNTSTGDVP